MAPHPLRMLVTKLLPHFIYDLLLVISHPIWALTDNKDGYHNGHHLLVCICGHSSLVSYHQISSKLHILAIFIKHWPKFQYEFSTMNDTHDGYQKGGLWSVCACGDSNLVLYRQISSKFHAQITLIKLSLKFEYKFCSMSDNKMTFIMAGFCQFALVDTLIMSPRPKRWGQVLCTDPVCYGVGVLFRLCALSSEPTDGF